MATSFSLVIKRFLNKINDPDLLSILPENLDSILTDFLISATVRFPQCKKDLNDMDIDAQQFNVDLNNTEIEIISKWMVFEWIDQQINRVELFRQSLSSKDYAMYSQANHLDKMLLLRQQLYSETNQMVTDYSYHYGNVDGLR